MRDIDDEASTWAPQTAPQGYRRGFAPSLELGLELAPWGISPQGPDRAQSRFAHQIEAAVLRGLASHRL
jgi:hypothetical protein